MNAEELLVKYEAHDKFKIETVLPLIKNKEEFLFAMSGKMAAGKDTIGELLSEKLGDLEHKEIKEVSFGQLIRLEVDKMVSLYKDDLIENDSRLNEFNVDLENLAKLCEILGESSAFGRSEDSRKALQFWGTDIRRNQNPNYWINSMFNFVIDNVSEGISINITDARFPNEVELVEDLGGVVIRLEISRELQKSRIKERDGIIVTDEALDHISETILDDYKFDKVFDNSIDPNKVAGECYLYLLR